MAEYICREAIIDDLEKEIEAGNVALDEDVWINKGLSIAIRDIKDIKAVDVQPVKKSKWCPPLMGQGKCDTYCERCHGKIMRNSTGIFEETPFCPHCGARMDKS